MNDKEKQIEEMAVLGCVRNPRAHTAEECAKCDFKQGMCNAYRHAEALYNAGYCKMPKDAVVLLVGEYNQPLDEKTIEYFINHNREIRKETAKEFAEKLKDRMNDREYMGIRYKQGVFSDNDIDELLKEYER